MIMFSTPYITSVVSGVISIGKLDVRKYKNHILKETPLDAESRRDNGDAISPGENQSAAKPEQEEMDYPPRTEFHKSHCIDFYHTFHLLSGFFTVTSFDRRSLPSSWRNKYAL